MSPKADKKTRPERKEIPFNLLREVQDQNYRRGLIPTVNTIMHGLLLLDLSATFSFYNLLSFFFNFVQIKPRQTTTVYTYN